MKYKPLRWGSTVAPRGYHLRHIPGSNAAEKGQGRRCLKYGYGVHVVSSTDRLSRYLSRYDNRLMSLPAKLRFMYAPVQFKARGNWVRRPLRA